MDDVTTLPRLTLNENTLWSAIEPMVDMAKMHYIHSPEDHDVRLERAYPYMDNRYMSEKEREGRLMWDFYEDMKKVDGITMIRMLSEILGCPLENPEIAKLIYHRLYARGYVSGQREYYYHR